MTSLRLAFLLLCSCAILTYVSHPAPAHAFMQEGGPDSGRQINGLAAEKGHETPEEKEEDETAQFKQSGPVKFIARITGLSVDHAYWLCVVLNFAIIAWLIFSFAKKKLPGVFSERTASIQKAMQEARKASEEANRRLSEIESRLARLDGEIGELRGAAEMEAAREEERIKAATQDDVRKVVVGAEQEIIAAAKAARRELRAYAADLVVSLAEKQIKVDPATDQSLVRKFAQQLSADDNRREPS